MPEWDAEITVAPDLAGRLLTEQFPALAGLAVRLIGSGWDNTAYAVGEEWVFRFPRREVVLPGIRTEIDVLPRLAPLLPVAVPLPEQIGEPSPAYPWPFWGARMLPGVELCDATDASREALATQLGRALRALHSQEVLDELGPSLGENWTYRADMQRRVPMLRKKLASLGELWRAPDAVDEILEQALALPPLEPRAVCHGDLHFRHVLVAGDRVTGLIDWIDLCRGEPALDLQLVWSALPPTARGAFFAAYGEVDAATLLRARVVAIFLGSALLEYGAHEGLPAIEREARAALDRALTS